jgi:hypothetical protein
LAQASCQSAFPLHAHQSVWLNQVEIRFSVLAGRALAGASFYPAAELKAHIEAFTTATLNRQTLRLAEIRRPPKTPQAMFRGSMVPGTSLVV